MKFNIPVTWMQRGIVEVEADSVEAAMKAVEVGVEFPKEQGEPIDDTMELDCFDPQAILKNWNNEAQTHGTTNRQAAL